jgi:hypothetical protein
MEFEEFATWEKTFQVMCYVFWNIQWTGAATTQGQKRIPSPCPYLNVRDQVSYYKNSTEKNGSNDNISDL